MDHETHDLLRTISAQVIDEDLAHAWVGLLSTGAEDDVPGVMIMGGHLRGVWLPDESMQTIAGWCAEAPDDLGTLERDDRGEWVCVDPDGGCVPLGDMADPDSPIRLWNVTAMGWDWYAPRPRWLHGDEGPSVEWLYSTPITLADVRHQIRQVRDTFGGLWHLDGNVWDTDYPVWACGWLDLRCAEWMEVCIREGVDIFGILLDLSHEVTD